jgi:DNA-binding IclR family transcriptional regulator
MTDRYNVPALQRGLQMLSLFSREKKELTGADFAHLLGLPRASIFRILQTLEQAGYIEKIDDSARYRLGVAVLRLGFEYIASLEITEHGRPILDALSDVTGYSSHLVVRDAREVVIVAKTTGFTKLFNSIQVGGRLPAHATVLGRVLLGGLTQVDLTSLYQHFEFKAYTPSTPVSIAQLFEKVDAIANAGYGISEGGFEAGISTVVAPVRGSKGDVCAAISITVPSASMANLDVSQMVSQVQGAAQQLTARLGHQPH